MTNWKSAISIEPSQGPVFGSDQANLSYPTVFPTVSFALECTDELMRIVCNAENIELEHIFGGGYNEEDGVATPNGCDVCADW